MNKNPKSNSKSLLSNPYYIFFALLILSFLFYGNTLKNKYSFDDNYVIVDKQIIQNGIASIPRIFRSYYVDNELERHSYRPVTTSSFAIEYQFFGANPFISHLINILLYAFCCFLVYRFVWYLDESKKGQFIALFAAIIFLILPVHSEVVNNIKSRDELLCFILGFLSLIQFLKYSYSFKKRNFIYGLAFFLLSILAKPTSLTLVALIPFILSYFKNLNIKKIAILIPIFSIPFLLFKVIKILFIKGNIENRVFEYFENPLFDGSYSFWDRIPVAFSTVGDYLKLIFYPKKFACYYGYNQVQILSWGDAKVWIAAFIITAMILTIIYFWKREKLITFGIIWFFISISMFSNLLRPVVGIIAERFAFFPSVGIAIAVAVILHKILLSQLLKKHFGIKVIFIVICLCLVGISWNKVINRNTNWFDKKTLLETDVINAPKSGKIHNLLANLLFGEIRNNPPPDTRKKLTLEAVKHYKQALEIYPEYAYSWNNLGTLTLNELSDPKQALVYYENAIKYKQDYKNALFGAGYACEILGNKLEALQYYQKLSLIDQNFLNVHSRINALKLTEN